MICPNCNISMHHLNTGGGFSGVDAYQTYDTLECHSCYTRAIEFYHTEFIEKGATARPILTLEQP